MKQRTALITQDGATFERLEGNGAVEYIARKTRAAAFVPAVADIIWSCSRAGVELVAVGGDLFVHGEAEAMSEVMPAVAAAREELRSALSELP